MCPKHWCDESTELTNNKKEKGTFFVKIKLTDLFGFADQEKITYGLGYNLCLKRNNNNDAIIRTGAADEAKINIKDIGWYIPHYSPRMENQQLVMDQILNKEPTELYYIERTVFRKDVNTNNNWTFELGMSGESTPTWVCVAFQARNKVNSQTHDNSTFDQLPVSSAVCRIGSENYPDNGIVCDYDRNNYYEAYNEIESFFRNHTETNFLKPFIDIQKFRTNYTFYIFDITKQKEHFAAQPIRLEFKFNAAINVADYTAFALALTPRLVSISSDGERQFDLL